MLQANFRKKKHILSPYCPAGSEPGLVVFAIYLFVAQLLRCFFFSQILKVKSRSKVSAFFAKESIIYKKQHIYLYNLALCYFCKHNLASKTLQRRGRILASFKLEWNKPCFVKGTSTRIQTCFETSYFFTRIRVDGALNQSGERFQRNAVSESGFTGFAYSHFEKRCRKKCTRQSRQVELWVVLSSLFFKEI